MIILGYKIQMLPSDRLYLSNDHINVKRLLIMKLALVHL